MVDRLPHPPDDNDTPDAALAEVVALLRENGERLRAEARRRWTPEMGRELARRLCLPLDEAIREAQG